MFHKISGKIIIYSILSFIFLFALGISSFIGLSKQKTSLKEIYETRFSAYKFSSLYSYRLLKTQNRVFKIFNLTSIHVAPAVIKNEIKTVNQEASNLKDIYIKNLRPSLNADYKSKFDSAMKTYYEWIQKVLKLIDVEGHDVGTATTMLPLLQRSFDQLEDYLNEMNKDNITLSEESYQKALVNYTSSFRFFIIITIASIALMLFFSIVLVKSVNTPINQFIAVINEVAKGDLNQQVDTKKKDEFGVLGLDFNQFVENLKKIINNLQKESDKLADFSNNLSDSAQRETAMIHKISASTSSVVSSIVSQKDLVNQSSNTVNHMIDAVSLVNNKTENANNQLNQSASAIEEIAANISSVSNTAKNADSASQKLEKASHEGSQVMEVLSEAIEEVADSSSKIVEMVQLIMDISEQTNLLAMNAAIEAAHAGEYGKGFAVVAEEIRKLADKSSSSAKEIQSVVKEISANVDKNLELSQKSKKTFTVLNNNVLQVKDYNHEISSAMKEQESANQAVLESVSVLRDIIAEIVSSLNEQTAQSENVGKMLKKLNVLSEEIVNSMEDEKSALKETTRSSEEVTEIAKQLEGTAKQFKEDFKTFKTK